MWYSKIKPSDELEQGDFLFECPIVIPPTKGEPKDWEEFSISTFNVIIITQSCDLAAKKISLVQVCPFVTLEEFCATNTNFDNYKSKESIRRGYLPGYHLLNKCEYLSKDDEFLIVDFKSTYSISFDFVEEFKNQQSQRIRINSPYKEHLSQAYARFYMRVGLPSDIPPFKKK